MPSYRHPIRLTLSKLPVRLAATRRATSSVPAARSRPRTLSRPRRISEGNGCSSENVCVAITLPVPPSINHQYATVNGRRLLSSTGRAYKAEVGQLVWLNLAKIPDRSILLSRLQSQPLSLSIRFYFTSALRRDVDGGLKIAQDALCEGLGVNDNRIVETHLYKRVDKTNPRIEVSLSSASLMV